MKEYLKKLNLTTDVEEMLQKSKKIIIPKTREELMTLSFGKDNQDNYDVEYDVPGFGKIIEANVTRCKNGAVVNYPNDYMRRRDPNCLFIADDLDTDKPRYADAYGEDFDPLRKETFNWLENQELIVMPFKSGGLKYGYDSVLISPKNAGFFCFWTFRFARIFKY